MRIGLAACGLAGAAAVVLAACGGSAGSPTSIAGSPSATATARTAGQLVTQMKSAVRAASSMELAGELPNGGHPVSLDLGVHRSGELAGTITQDGVPLRLIGAGGRYYVKATPAFLRELHSPAAVCTVMCGKYVELTSAQGRELASGLSMPSLTRSLLAGLPTFSKQGSTTIAGQPVITLRGADGSTLYVAATGRPYPVRVVAPPGHHESVRFSRWDNVAAPAAPRGDQVINLSQLKAGSS